MVTLAKRQPVVMHHSALTNFDPFVAGRGACAFPAYLGPAGRLVVECPCLFSPKRLSRKKWLLVTKVINANTLQTQIFTPSFLTLIMQTKRTT